MCRQGDKWRWDHGMHRDHSQVWNPIEVHWEHRGNIQMRKLVVGIVKLGKNKILLLKGVGDR